MPNPAGCGHFAPNRDYQGEALAIKEQRRAEAADVAETIAEVEARLGKLCDLCQERTHDYREFGAALPYYACSDVSACEETRKANLKKGFHNG